MERYDNIIIIVGDNVNGFRDIDNHFRICIGPRPVASQPGGGGLNLDGRNTRRTPPLDIVRVTSSIWKTPPLLDIHKHPPPLDIARVTSSIWKTPPLLDIHKHPPPLDIARVTSSTYSKGGTKLLKGGTKLLKGGTKLLKGGTKLLKGGTKSLGWATGGGSYDPPDPPLATGLGPIKVNERAKENAMLLCTTV